MTGSFLFLPRVAAVPIAITLLTASFAAAQAPAPATSEDATARTGLVWSVQFARSVQGKKLLVTTADGRQFEGVFTVSPTSLNTTWRNAGIAVPFEQIVRVEKPTYRMRYLSLIGLAAGFGIGAWSACQDDSYCFEEPYWFLLGGVGAGIGAAAGGAIGAVLNVHSRDRDVIYDAKRRTTTTMVFAPILSPTRKGVAFSMTWR